MRYFIFGLIILSAVLSGAQAQVLRRGAFDAIETARIKLDAGDYAAAHKAAQSILHNTQMTAYEKAVAQHIRGAIFAAEGQYDQAIAAFETARASDVLPPALARDALYHLAQLHLAADKPQAARRLLAMWFAAINGTPAPAAYGLKAHIHFVLQDWQTAEEAIRMALDGGLDKSSQSPPPKNWVHILLAILAQQDRYDEMQPILADAVRHWSDDKSFWQQLAAVYDSQQAEAAVFATYQTMYAQNMLISSDDLLRMARLYLYHNVPIKAAALLQTGLQTGRIVKKAEHYALLAQAYQLAREWGKSIAPLRQAAELADVGKYHQQLGLAYVQNENWQAAIAAFEQALAKGELKHEADVWLRLGLAHMRLAQWEAAIAALRQAGADDALANQAFQWIRTIEARLQQ